MVEWTGADTLEAGQEEAVTVITEAIRTCLGLETMTTESQKGAGGRPTRCSKQSVAFIQPCPSVFLHAEMASDRAGATTVRCHNVSPARTACKEELRE